MENTNIAYANEDLFGKCILSYLNIKSGENVLLGYNSLTNEYLIKNCISNGISKKDKEQQELPFYHSPNCVTIQSKANTTSNTLKYAAVGIICDKSAN
jgi:hypothetical protein